MSSSSTIINTDREAFFLNQSINVHHGRVEPLVQFLIIIIIFYCGLMVHITDTRAQKVVSCTSAHITETVFAHDQRWEEQIALFSPQLYRHSQELVGVFLICFEFVSVFFEKKQIFWICRCLNQSFYSADLRIFVKNSKKLARHLIKNVSQNSYMYSHQPISGIFCTKVRHIKGIVFSI